MPGIQPETLAHRANALPTVPSLRPHIYSVFKWQLAPGTRVLIHQVTKIPVARWPGQQAWFVTVWGLEAGSAQSLRPASCCLFSSSSRSETW